MLRVALTQIFAIGGMMSWNKNAAVSYIRSHANSSSQNNCVRYTRDAIAAGGLNLVYTLQARNYGGPLINAGFVEISPSSALIAGDIAIIQPCAGGNSAGHMAMYDGTAWFSDFRQRSIYPSDAYQSAKPAYKIYRKK